MKLSSEAVNTMINPNPDTSFGIFCSLKYRFMVILLLLNKKDTLNKLESQMRLGQKKSAGLIVSKESEVNTQYNCQKNYNEKSLKGIIEGKIHSK